MLKVGLNASSINEVTDQAKLVKACETYVNHIRFEYSYLKTHRTSHSGDVQKRCWTILEINKGIPIAFLDHHIRFPPGVFLVITRDPGH